MKTVTLLLLAASSVFAQKIQIESDQSVNFAKFRTFTIRAGRLNSSNPSLNNELTRKQIDSDIEKYLGARGLTFVPRGMADLNVSYTLGAARNVQNEVYPAGWRGWGTRVVKVPYTEGTLVVDLRDPTTRSLVWRGSRAKIRATPARSRASSITW